MENFAGLKTVTGRHTVSTVLLHEAIHGRTPVFETIVFENDGDGNINHGVTCDEARFGTCDEAGAHHALMVEKYSGPARPSTTPYQGMDIVALVANGLLLATTCKGAERVAVFEMVVLLAEQMTGDELQRAIKRSHDVVEAEAMRNLSLYQKAGEA